jgi:hypothetical protein
VGSWLSPAGNAGWLFSVLLYASWVVSCAALGQRRVNHLLSHLINTGTHRVEAGMRGCRPAVWQHLRY